MDEQHRCDEKVWRGVMVPFHPCQKKGTLQHDGRWYCKTHHPPTVAAKKAARHAAWEAEFKAKQDAMAAARAERAEIERRAALYPKRMAEIKRLQDALQALVDRWDDQQDMDTQAGLLLFEAARKAIASVEGGP